MKIKKLECSPIIGVFKDLSFKNIVSTPILSIFWDFLKYFFFEICNISRVLNLFLILKNFKTQILVKISWLQVLLPKKYCYFPRNKILVIMEKPQVRINTKNVEKFYGKIWFFRNFDNLWGAYDGIKSVKWKIVFSVKKWQNHKN